jgi:hypothetical protein
MTDIKTSKNTKKIICVSCDFYCSKKGDFNRHILTAKHQKRMKGLHEGLQEDVQKNYLKCICECGNEYFHRQSLSKHKKHCNFGKSKINDIKEPDKNNEIISLLIDRQAKSDEIIELLKDDNKEIKDLFLKLYNDSNELMKASQEQNKLIIELTKNGINNNNTNCNNKTTFNLNFFLNDTCKNAMNLSDLINSVKLNYQDFINVGTVGYVQGITNIVVKNVSNLSEIERPIHCTDEKRGTIYIKDDDKWEKDEEHKKFNKFISTVANKNAREMTSFKKEFPDCIKSRSIHSDKYNKSLVEAMGGAGDNDDEKNDKIKKNILKSIIIKTNK